jgi:starch-binding outer membrane protein SusE/F
MKNILKTTILAFLTVLFVSCEDAIDPLASANGFALRATTNNSPLVLTTATNANTALVLEWDKSDNGVPTKEANYYIEVAKAGTNFENSILGNLGSAINLVAGVRTYTLKVQEINDLANKLPNFSFCQQMSIDVRIKSKLGDYDASAFFQPSTNFVTINVTPYSTAKSKLAFVINGSTPDNSDKIASSSFTSTTDYEGYMYLQPGNYKFYKPDACGDFTAATQLGGAAGILSVGGTAINIATAGHYQVKANLVANTYTVKFYNTFGVFGSAKSVSGTGNAVPMIDSANNNIWNLTINLLKGKKYQFKSNAWSGALAGDPLSIPSAGTTTISILGASTGLNLIEGATATDIIVPGVYDGTKASFLITLDVSKPRNYSYTMTAQ